MRDTVKRWLWGVVFVALFVMFGATACRPAKADTNPWDITIAARHPADIIVRSGVRIHLRVGPRRDHLRGVTPELAAKASQIVAACGSRVSSAVRHTRVAGTGRMSLHASGRAVDLVGNPACIYRMLAGWPGGVSTDYARARHVHVSYGGSEHGQRFVHQFTSRRYASRRVRYSARG